MVIVFDLDDTLYDEIDFIKSGFKEISNYLKNKKYFDFMWQDFIQNGSGKTFDNLINHFKLNIQITKLIEIYRFHKPNITLPQSSIDLLSITNTNCLISDGHYITQQNKFEALKLYQYIKFPIFTDYYHTKKPDTKPFQMVMKKYNSSKYIYIADNPKKDFIAPKKLNWITIRYKNPNGIYKNIPNNADFEFSSKKQILHFLKDFK